MAKLGQRIIGVARMTLPLALRMNYQLFSFPDRGQEVGLHFRPMSAELESLYIKTSHSPTPISNTHYLSGEGEPP